MSVSGTTKATGAKRSREAEHFTTSWDEPIPGLAKRPSDGRWRIIGTDITYTEADERLAVHRFRVWQAGQGKATATLDIPKAGAKATNVIAVRAAVQSFPEPAIDLAGVQGTFLPTDYKPPTAAPPLPKPIRVAMDGDRIEFFRDPINAEAFWPWLRKLILDRPQYVAEMTGIESLAWLPELQRPQPSPTLESVGDLYFDKAQITEHERRKSKLFWSEFVEALGVATLREVTAERAAGYLDDVLSADNSPTFAKHRFGKIKTIINFARKRGLNSTDCRTALDSCAVLVPPRPVPLDPHPIDPKDFATLLAAGDDQERAVLLLALNACMYGSEVADVKWSDLDRDAGTLVTDRGKTTVARVAVLWPRTVEALRKLPHRIDSPFVTVQGNPLNPNTANKLFRDLRTRAGVKDEVKFADVRDGAYTAAVQGAGVGFETARILAGHRVGMSDHYVKRNPRLVAGACEAIERAYFGPA